MGLGSSLLAGRGVMDHGQIMSGPWKDVEHDIFHIRLGMNPQAQGP